jgi:hypothetical protein
MHDTLAATPGLSLVRDMKARHGAFRYSVGGTASAVMEVVPQHFSRALVEIQLRSENYLPGRSLAHICGHYLAAVEEVAQAVKEERAKAKALEKAGRSGGGAQAPSRHKSLSKGPQKEYDAAIYTAYVRAEPVHLLMLSDYCSAHDTADDVWRAPKSSTVLAGRKYGWVMPLFNTYRLATNSETTQLVDGLSNPGLDPYSSSLQNLLSITIVHLPLVPSALNDMAAWDQVVTLPAHKEAL